MPVINLTGNKNHINNNTKNNYLIQQCMKTLLQFFFNISWRSMIDDQVTQIQMSEINIDLKNAKVVLLFKSTDLNQLTE